MSVVDHDRAPLPEPRDPLLTVRQLASREGMTERRVRHLLANGLPAYRAHGVRIRWSEYVGWLESRRR